MITLPPRVKTAEAARFLEAHKGWLEARLQRQRPRMPFAQGTLLPLRGVPMPIEHRAPIRGETRIENTPDGPVLIVHGTPEHVAGRILRFLKTQALADLTQASQKYAQRLGVSLGTIRLKDTKSRWGSCSARGDLNYSWRLILAPPAVLDYLCAHEVAHRLEMNHSVRYWRHVQAICPDFEAQEAWLKKHGRTLHDYGA